MPGIVDFIAGMAQGGVNPDTGQPRTFGDRMAAGVKSMDEGYANYAQDAQKAKALRQVVAAYAQDEPDPDKQKQIIAQSHTMGLGDLEGYVQGHAVRAAQQKQQADIQEQLARSEYYKQFGAQRAQDATDDQTAGQFLRNYLTAPQSGGAPSSADTAAADLVGQQATGDSQPMTPEERMNYAAAKTPGMSGRTLPKIMDSLSKWQQLAGGGKTGSNFFPAEPDKMAQDVPGLPGLKRVITGPKSSVLRDANGNTLTPQTDDEGNLLGYTMETGGGNSKFVTAPKTGKVTDQDEFKSLVSEQTAIEKNPMVAYSQPLQARLDEIHARKKDILTGNKAPQIPAAAPGASQADPLPLVNGKPDATKLTQGKIYQTQYGAAKWNGKQFQRLK